MLEKQLASCLERGLKPSTLSDPQRLSLVLLAKLAGFRDAVVIVKPRTLIAWERKIKAFDWWIRSRRRGRPPLPRELQLLIRRMALENPTWTAGRIARELGTKLPVDADTESVRKYMPRKPARRGVPRGDQQWSSFIHNHAKVIVACDFAVSMRLRFQVLYVFVMMEIGSRRILHVNVTDHPTAEWTTQQLRTAIPADAGYRYLLHDRDSIFSRDLDAAMGRLDLKVLRSPVRAPRANAFVERLIGSLRRELLDWVIPLTENQLRALVHEWAEHYNRERPHMSLGPGFPHPAEGLPVPRGEHRHRPPANSRVVSKPVLAGLHHEYRLEKIAAQATRSSLFAQSVPRSAQSRSTSMRLHLTPNIFLDAVRPSASDSLANRTNNPPVTTAHPAPSSFQDWPT